MAGAWSAGWPWASTAPRTAPAALPDHPVLDALGFDPLHLDAIQARCELATGDLQAQLVELELQGRIARLDDGRYQRLK
jgi:DNA processing protein